MLFAVSIEYMNASVAASAFKIKDMPKYYVYYLPNRIPVLKDLYNNYQAKNITFKKFAWGTASETFNIYAYLDIHKMAGEYLQDYFKGHAQTIETPHKNNHFLTNKNIRITTGAAVAVGLVYYAWRKYYGHKEVDAIALGEIYI